MTAKDAIVWLQEAARYFEKRDTRGEDSAFWSNLYNAEAARDIANLIKELTESENK
jgi:hypothetical protein